MSAFVQGDSVHGESTSQCLFQYCSSFQGVTGFVKRGIIKWGSTAKYDYLCKAGLPFVAWVVIQCHDNLTTWRQSTILKYYPCFAFQSQGRPKLLGFVFFLFPDFACWTCVCVYWAWCGNTDQSITQDFADTVGPMLEAQVCLWVWVWDVIRSVSEGCNDLLSVCASLCTCR